MRTQIKQRKRQAVPTYRECRHPHLSREAAHDHEGLGELLRPEEQLSRYTRAKRRLLRRHAGAVDRINERIGAFSAKHAYKLRKS